MIAGDITALIGKTPLVRLNRVIPDGDTRIFAKLEFFNPTHSIKDRVALAMIRTAERQGLIKKTETIIVEPSSGNMAISLAAICSALDYRLILVMPESTSGERIKLLKAFNCEIILTPSREGMIGAFKKASDLIREDAKKYYMPQQFKNPANPVIHEKTTAPEIWRDTKGNIEILICGVGTAGTITGCGRYLKKKKKHIKIVGVEPARSPVLSGGKPGPHSIIGIGPGFVPSHYDPLLVDEIIQVTDEDAIATTRRLAREEGIFCGISSGAACWAALKLAQSDVNRGKSIVVIFPDTGTRYLNIL